MIRVFLMNISVLLLAGSSLSVLGLSPLSAQDCQACESRVCESENGAYEVCHKCWTGIIEVADCYHTGWETGYCTDGHGECDAKENLPAELALVNLDKLSLEEVGSSLSALRSRVVWDGEGSRVLLLDCSGGIADTAVVNSHLGEALVANGTIFGLFTPASMVEGLTLAPAAEG